MVEKLQQESDLGPRTRSHYSCSFYKMLVKLEDIPISVELCFRCLLYLVVKDLDMPSIFQKSSISTPENRYSGALLLVGFYCNQGPVVQSIVSLTNSLRAQLVK